MRWLRQTPSGWALAATAFVVYALLGQDTLYGGDGHTMLLSLKGGNIGANRHYGTLPLLAALRELLSFTGLPDHRLITLTSALGTALGVYWTWLACRVLEYRRDERVAITALVATAPAVVFFATVVEYHGIFFCFSQLTFWTAVRFMARPTYERAIALGAVAACAWLFHSSGVLLVVAYGCMVLGSKASIGASTRELLVRLGVAVLVQAALIVVFTLLLMATDIAASSPYSSEIVSGRLLQSVPLLPLAVYSEWLLEFLPLSVLFLAAPYRKELRGPFLGVLGGVVVFCWMAALVALGREYGAYLLPMAAPAAVLVLRLLRPKWSLVVAAVALVVGVFFVLRHDDRAGFYREFGAGLRATAGDRPTHVLVVPLDEWAGALVHAPQYGVRCYLSECQLDPVLFDQAAHELDDQIESERPNYGIVLISKSSVELAEAGGELRAGPNFVRALRAHYNFLPVEKGGFVGYQLEPK